MAKEGSVAPRERINIVYKPATGDAQEEVELPLKLLMMGDYTGRPDSTPLEDREPVDIDKDNFDKVMKAQNISLSVSVPNRLAGKEGDEMPVNLKFESLKDFNPESIVNQTPELRKLLELRQALNALKGPLGNVPEFRKKIQSIVADKGARERILKELSRGDEKK